MSSLPTDIQYTSLGPQHELMTILTTKSPTSSNPPPSRILIKEEKHDFTDIMFQDSQDPWEEFTSILHPSEASNAPFSNTTPQTDSHAPFTSTVLPMMTDTPTGSPTRPYYDNRQWWQVPFGEVDSDVNNLSPLHSF